eukprot:TRINITY_DN117_c0_g1_i1.p1 TRINITY_DN117_c0_g1~~TRINITY_DN117_c0_g1_i1.p1  ORF type:complete len:376 (-),score=94.91 TRINITY_DN117_c0_g1_i1:496-1623(-)
MAHAEDSRKLAAYYVGALRLLAAQAKEGPAVRQDESAQILAELHEDALGALLCHKNLPLAEQQRLQDIDKIVRRAVYIFLQHDGENWASAASEIEDCVEHGLAELEKHFPGVQDENLYGEFVDVSRIAKFSALLPIQQRELDFVPEMMKLLIEALPSTMAAAIASNSSSTASSDLWLEPEISKNPHGTTTEDGADSSGFRQAREADHCTPADSVAVAKATLGVMADDREVTEEAVAAYAKELQKNRPGFYAKLVSIANQAKEEAAKGEGSGGGGAGGGGGGGGEDPKGPPGPLRRIWNWLCGLTSKVTGWVQSAFKWLWEKTTEFFNILLSAAKTVVSCVANIVAKAADLIYSILMHIRIFRKFFKHGYSRVHVD